MSGFGLLASVFLGNSLSEREIKIEALTLEQRGIDEDLSNLSLMLADYNEMKVNKN